MGMFDDLFDDDEDMPELFGKQNLSFFRLLMETKKEHHSQGYKPSYKDLEAYSCDEEADEDGFFDDVPL